MITICRAEDGQVYQVNASIRDIEATGSLERFLYQEIGIEEDAAISYLSDGRRLTNSNIRELGTSQDGFIFVFNKHYLEHDVEGLLKLLLVEPLFQPVIEDATASTPPIRHTQLTTSYTRAAHKHHELIQHYLQSIMFQHQGLQIASKNLDFNVLAIYDTFEGIAANAQRELQKQASLLKGVDADLELISKVAVHVEFCSEAVRMAIEAGDPQRVLADYVSKQKMQTVKDTCTKTHEDLSRRFGEVEAAVSRLKEGANDVRANIDTNGTLDEASSCSRRSQDLLDRITDSAATLEGPASDADALLQDLKHCDDAQRHELQQIVTKKNLYTHQCLTTLHHISTLNNELLHLPQVLSALSESFRNKANFSHIQRLHNMLYAYGATIIEIVRRKEFTTFFYQRAQGILEVMAKLSASERKRRQVYRSEIHGLLPFETHGMDDPVPTIDFTPTGSTEAVYSFQRSDVDDLLYLLNGLEGYAQTLSKNGPISLDAVRNCRMLLEKLINKMDALETGFDKIAERSLLSQSRLTSSRRRSIEAEERAIQELAHELQEMQDTLTQKERAFQNERSSMHAESQDLKAELGELESKHAEEQERSKRLERELQQVRAQMESESVSRRILEDRNGELSADISLQRKEIARALSDATEQAKEAETLRQELVRVREEFEEVKQLEQRNADKVAHLLEEQSNTLRNLEEARARGEDLELQIQAARRESGDVHQALKGASAEKDRLLKAQASEHDRIIRDHIAEADGDRAILGRQFSELQGVLGHRERELKEVRSDLEVANTDAAGLREELQRVERELHEVRHVERILRDDLKAGRASQHVFEQRIENNSRLNAQILDVAIHFRNSHAKVLHAAQMLGSHSGSNRHSTLGLAESAFASTGLRHSVIPLYEEPSPIDPDDPSGALDILREFDHDHFLDTVIKTIRKWQKQCKEYRERSKGKISFRNFAKGDLALFLPTRNSVSKPWAAFNVSFPHYFLQANDHLAEQLKSREWIVARITSLTERVVDQKDPKSNPFGLGDGIKYYMLEVEDWTQPSQNRKRFPTKKLSNDIADDKEGPSSPRLSPSALPPVPPEPEVEDTFMVTHPTTFSPRARSNSSPPTRPSSLSRLLAQAAHTAEGIDDRTPGKPQKPVIVEVLSTSPIQQTGTIWPSVTTNNVVTNGRATANGSSSNLSHATPNSASPLRPGSRSSRLSITSRFPSRMPTLGPVAGSQPKAAATTALSDQTLTTSLSASTDNNPFRSPLSPSPEELISIANPVANTHYRRRTASYHPPRIASSSSQSTVTVGPSQPTPTATTTLASLANSWGMSFGRKKKAELGVGKLTPPVESPGDGNAMHNTFDYLSQRENDASAQ